MPVCIQRVPEAVIVCSNTEHLLKNNINASYENIVSKTIGLGLSGSSTSRLRCTGR